MYLKIIIISQLKKIVPKKMNFGSPNLTKQKKKPRNKKRSLGTQQNVTQKRIIGTHQNVTTFSQYFFISNCSRS